MVPFLLLAVEANKSCTLTLWNSKRSTGVSKRIIDFKENQKISSNMRDKLQELQFRIRARDTQLENLESLLDRILICINAYGSGEGEYPVPTILKSIVQEINLCRLLEADAYEA